MSTPQHPESGHPAEGQPLDGPDVLEPTGGAPTAVTATPAADADVDHAPPLKGLDDHGRVKRTRAATAWASSVALALVTILFVVFVVQNSQSVSIHFLWLDGSLAAAAALLIAAVAGALLVGIPAAVRIAQLRHALRRNAQS